MNWSLQDIAQQVGCSPDIGEQVIKHIIIDSRNVNAGKDSLFVAIQGERNDGHDYIVNLYNRGVRTFLVKEGFKNQFNDATFLAVKDTLKAFQHLALIHRSKFSIPIVGITGSNGKTIVKEWLHTVLRRDYVITRSPKSFNSQVGVPLSVLQLNEQSELGVFEAGISQPNEMSFLENIISPTIGVFTNLGAAHDVGFVSRAQKLEEKLKLFSESDIIIYNSDQDQVHSVLGSNKRALSWGKDGDIRICAGEEFISIEYNSKAYEIRSPFLDGVHFENLGHVIATLLYLKFKPEVIEEKIAHLLPVRMRLSLLSGNNNSLIIDDSYSNDLPALELALNFLKKHQQGRDSVVVLSDILQSGKSENDLYEEVAQMVNSVEPKELLLVGETSIKYAELFKAEVYKFKSSQELLEGYSFSGFGHKIVLFKGARKFQFERLVKKLSSKVHETSLEINLDKLVNNLNYFKSLIYPSTKVMAMVKAYAYGSGYLEVAHALQYQKVDYLAVAYVDEGVDLRENGIQTPILVLNVEPDNFDKLEKYNIEPEVFRIDQLKQYEGLAKEELNIHLKLDTGMHRLGFDLNQCEELISFLRTAKRVKVKSVFTHLSSADDPKEDTFTNSQLEAFDSMSSRIESAVGYEVIKHVLNSAGVQRFSEKQYDMVRLGVGLYGIGVEKEHQQNLSEVGVLKSRVSQVRAIEAGESIGYNRMSIAKTKMTIATIAIGYADGYDRRFSNGVGNVFIGGEIRSVVGNVCMDMIMVDATGLNISVGEEVEILGGVISWDKAAKSIGTISYELLTGIGERIKRVFFEGDLI